MRDFLVEHFFTTNSVISILKYYRKTEMWTSNLRKSKEEKNKKYQ